MKVIYEQSNGIIAVIIPANKNIDFNKLTKLAKKTVPNGLPFWVVEDDILPENRDNRDDWVLDGTQGDPDGYGGEA